MECSVQAKAKLGSSFIEFSVQFRSESGVLLLFVFLLFLFLFSLRAKYTLAPIFQCMTKSTLAVSSSVSDLH